MSLFGQVVWNTFFAKGLVKEHQDGLWEVLFAQAGSQVVGFCVLEISLSCHHGLLVLCSPVVVVIVVLLLLLMVLLVLVENLSLGSSAVTCTHFMVVAHVVVSRPLTMLFVCALLTVVKSGLRGLGISRWLLRPACLLGLRLALGCGHLV